MSFGVPLNAGDGSLIGSGTRPPAAESLLALVVSAEACAKTTGVFSAMGC
jgi:hypothetical protein